MMALLLFITHFTTALNMTYWFGKLWVVLKTTIVCLLILVLGVALAVIHEQWGYPRLILDSLAVVLFVPLLSIAGFPVASNMTSCFEWWWLETKAFIEYPQLFVTGVTYTGMLWTYYYRRENSRFWICSKTLNLSRPLLFIQVFVTTSNMTCRLGELRVRKKTTNKFLLMPISEGTFTVMLSISYLDETIAMYLLFLATGVVFTVVLSANRSQSGASRVMPGL